MKHNNDIICVQDILKILPHRFPFLLVDRILEFKKNGYVRTIKNVSFGDFFISGHFPKKPIFPGVLILESIIQSSCILMYKSYKKKELQNKEFFFSSIKKTYFKKFVFPGDQIVIKIKFLKKLFNFFYFQGIAKVNNLLVCESVVSLYLNYKNKSLYK